MRRLTYCLFYLERRSRHCLILKSATSRFSICCRSHVVTVSSWPPCFHILFVSLRQMNRIFGTNREVFSIVLLAKHCRKGRSLQTSPGPSLLSKRHVLRRSSKRAFIYGHEKVRPFPRRNSQSLVTLLWTPRVRNLIQIGSNMRKIQQHCIYDRKCGFHGTDLHQTRTRSTAQWVSQKSSKKHGS